MKLTRAEQRARFEVSVKAVSAGIICHQDGDVYFAHGLTYEQSRKLCVLLENDPCFKGAKAATDGHGTFKLMTRAAEVQ